MDYSMIGWLVMGLLGLWMLNLLAEGSRWELKAVMLGCLGGVICALVLVGLLTRRL